MNQVPKEKFNDFGTLTKWRDIIFHTKEINGKVRGGFFLCIPNFEEDSSIFEIKHGEYRKTPPSYIENEKVLEGKWGKINVETFWEEDDNSLSVKIKIISLRNNTYIRPGFHPYFFVGNDFQIKIKNKDMDKSKLPDDKLIILNDHTDEAELITNNKNIKIKVSIYNKDVSFGVWSDSKNNYVCIEPIVGEGLDSNNLPKAFQLREDEALEFSLIINYL